MLKGYMTHRSGQEETFLAFARRHEIEVLKTIFESGGA
jgi:ferredoxin-nitrite reductase